jgi:hypothetical protein
MRRVKLDDIRIDGGTQGRSVIDQQTVYNYLEHMKEGDEFPKMFTVFDGATYWLVDGFHRYHAYKLLGIKEIDIDYKPGTLEEAQVLSFGVNGTHGKPRTNEDKRQVVLAALEHSLTKNKSDREIAKICAVSPPFVAAVRNPAIKERQDDNRLKTASKKANEVKSDYTLKQNNDEKASFAPAEEPDPQAGAAPDEEEIKAAELAIQADQETMYKLLESDDALATAHEEIKRLNHLNAQLSVRINGLMNERNEAVKMVKKLQKELDRVKDKK